MKAIATAVSMEEVEEAMKVVVNAVDKKLLLEAFGTHYKGKDGVERERLTEHPNGTWEFHLETWKEMKLFDEMDQARMRADMYRGFRQHAAIRDVVIWNPITGQSAVVPEHAADDACRVRGKGWTVRRRTRKANPEAKPRARRGGRWAL